MYYFEKNNYFTRLELFVVPEAELWGAEPVNIPYTYFHGLLDFLYGQLAFLYGQLDFFYGQLNTFYMVNSTFYMVN